MIKNILFATKSTGVPGVPGTCANQMHTHWHIANNGESVNREDKNRGVPGVPSKTAYSYYKNFFYLKNFFTALIAYFAWNTWHSKEKRAYTPP